MNSDQLNLVAEWEQSQRELNVAKEKELALRNAVITELFDNKGEGTKNVPLANGWKLKAQFKQNYKVIEDKIEWALNKIENSGPEGEFIAKRLIDFKPKLSVKEYKLLEPKLQKIIDLSLEIKSAQASLELVAPRQKQNLTNQEAL